MTRINIGIAPYELCDQHLVAEYRELPRVVSVMWKRALKHGTIDEDRLKKGVPDAPTLGKGHVLYFTMRGSYLKRRFESLVAEMNRRGFKTTHLELRAMPGGMPDLPISVEHEVLGRTLLLARLLEKRKSMKRKPTWTTPTSSNGA